MARGLYRALKRRYHAAIRGFRWTLEAAGWSLLPSRDYYSPVTRLAVLENKVERWHRPSALGGLYYDLAEMRRRLSGLMERFGGELTDLPSFAEAKTRGYGPGFTEVDAVLLYLVLRDVRPRRYYEVGSGLSTFYASLACARNEAEGRPMEVVCIDPFPGERLGELGRVRPSEVQDVPVGFFESLESGDVLFVDSTHVVRIDGDVPYLVLEVLPRLARGVWVHFHDLHLPFNVPHPPGPYLLRAKWPRLWTEAMLVQAFLAFNEHFRIELSAPLLRHHDEAFLTATVPGYRPVEEDDFDTHYGSLWIRRIDGP